jgi:hypothetical protein
VSIRETTSVVRGAGRALLFVYPSIYANASPQFRKVAETS